MDASGRRFIFLTTLANTTVNQLATAEIDTPNSGLAPTVTDPSCTPPYFIIGSNAPAFAFKPSPTNSLVADGGAQAGFLYKDILDTVSWQGSTLNDNGGGGDPVAGDGIYSNNGGYFSSQPPLGYRMLRFKAEILGSDGLYHSHAVDTGPCFILAAAPGGSGPVISSTAPPNAPPSASVTINGSGFDPVATNNYVLFGSQSAQVVSVNPAGTQLVVTVPIDSPLGAVPLSVSSLGQTSPAFTVNVPDPLAAYLGISQLTGLEIWGTVSQMYRIERTTNLQTSNSWIPLTNLFLSTRPTSWFDQTSTNQAKGFYRAIRVP
jgi:IPT/TIG domain